MKYWGAIFFTLIICMPIWGQNAVNNFSFVSTLYAPKTSFNEIEIKDGPTQFNASEAGNSSGATFNVGSTVSEEGTIHVEGNPVNIDALKMASNTQISDTADGVKWLVDTLRIGNQGEVTVKHLIANEVRLKNTSFDTQLESCATVFTPSLVWTESGRAKNALNASWPNSGSTEEFNFQQKSESNGQATWRQLTRNSDETIDSNNAPSKYYPISTNW